MFASGGASATLTFSPEYLGAPPVFSCSFPHSVHPVHAASNTAPVGILQTWQSRRRCTALCTPCDVIGHDGPLVPAASRLRWRRELLARPSLLPFDTPAEEAGVQAGAGSGGVGLGCGGGEDCRRCVHDHGTWCCGGPFPAEPPEKHDVVTKVTRAPGSRTAFNC